jgi:mannose-6-phosphate isomerase-like protein (cupin superfamily)
MIGTGGITDPDRKLWKHMINIAYLEPGKTKVHTHPAENVLYVLEGEGVYVSNEDPREETPIKPGDMCIALGHQPHGFLNTGSKRLYYIAVEGPVERS